MEKPVWKQFLQNRWFSWLYKSPISYSEKDLWISVTYQNSSEIAQAAIEAIDAIGNVTKNSGDTIKDARYMYNKINSDAKKYVTNYDKLQAAEKKFKEYSN